MKKGITVLIFLFMLLIPAQTQASSRVVLIPSRGTMNFGDQISFSITIFADEFETKLHLDPRFVTTSITSRECGSNLQYCSSYVYDHAASYTIQAYLPLNTYGGDAFSYVEVYDRVRGVWYKSDIIRTYIPTASQLSVELIPPSYDILVNKDVVFTVVIHPSQDAQIAIKLQDSAGIMIPCITAPCPVVQVHDTVSISIHATFSACGKTTISALVYDNSIYSDSYIESASTEVSVCGCNITYLPLIGQ